MVELDNKRRAVIYKYGGIFASITTLASSRVETIGEKDKLSIKEARDVLVTIQRYYDYLFKGGQYPGEILRGNEPGKVYKLFYEVLLLGKDKEEIPKFAKSLEDSLDNITISEEARMLVFENFKRLDEVTFEELMRTTRPGEPIYF